MFGQKKTQPTKTAEPAVAPELADQIHTMPDRFYIQPKQRRSGVAGLVVVGVVVLGGVVGAAFYLNANLDSLRSGLTPPPPAPVAVANQNTTAPTPTPPTPPANLNRPLNANVAPTNTNSAANQNLNTNLNANTNVAPPPATLPSAPDVDGDGLTQAEEILFGSDPNRSDTDADSYGDGQEILNFYDPAKPRLTATESGLFKTLTNSAFTILYPGSWTVTGTAPDAEEVFFRSAGGEFVEVLILAKPATQSLEQWYAAEFPTQDINATTPVIFSVLSGLRTEDSQTYYLVAPGNSQTVYVLTYNSGTLTQLNFLATFMAMAKSFAVQQP